MRRQNEKKIFSLVQYNLIDTMIKDISYVEGITESTIAEEILLGTRPGLLPNNAFIATLIRSSYLHEDAVNTMYRSIMLEAAAKDYTTKSPTEEFEVIKSLNSLLCLNSQNSLDQARQSEIKWFASQFEMFLKYLEAQLNTLPNSSLEAFALKSEITFGRDLYHELCTEPWFSRLSNFLSIAIKTWEYAGRNTFTYRMIAAMLQIVTISSSPENKVDTVKRLREIYG